MDRISTTQYPTAYPISSTLNAQNTLPGNSGSADYLSALATWVKTEINGEQAAVRIRQWLDSGDCNAVLNLSELSLRSLPPFPSTLKALKARNLLATFQTVVIALRHYCVSLTLKFEKSWTTISIRMEFNFAGKH